METQLKTCESQLKDLRLRGEELSLVAPKMVNPTEIKALQTSYIELQQKVSTPLHYHFTEHTKSHQN